ncbi:ABC transporter substrate-binding protein [Sulfitobacter sp. D35]|uniref:ABC transporter substrate-binding protein n=1 Tax=Sulfitobacter sp. D35 TaxID=3083252 RepID=UPI00296ED99E|nr:ABC transporter substrate-binding protein [Sulfitobacter sp. D35]MDW4498030.1 ABC transporter substrate-binding protein [Sulfitobacter sp. D35]
MNRVSRIDRRALFTTGAAAAVLAAAGISAEAEPRRGGRLRMALSGAGRSDSFDTRRSQGLFMQVAGAGTVFDTLTEVAADGTLRGELATGWEGSADARSWTLTLREGVRFHDGAAFTAHDVRASFDLHRDSGLDAVRRIEILSDHRIRVDFDRPSPQFPFLLSDARFVIYPHRRLEDAMAWGIGTGLYKVRRCQPGRDLIAERVAEHYKDGHAGWFDEVELVSIPKAEVRAEALRGRYVDVADLADAQGLDRASDFALLPDAQTMTQAAQPGVRFPRLMGRALPLDNLRAAERWWMA